jgi:K+-sensing histidine kinase KdpD
MHQMKPERLHEAEPLNYQGRVYTSECPIDLPNKQGWHFELDEEHDADVLFLKDFYAKDSAEPRGASCLAKILGSVADSLKGCPDCSKYGCAITLQVIDKIDFDCQQPFLATVLQELVTNATVAQSTRVEVLATQYRGRLFIQVADNGLGLPEGIKRDLPNGFGQVHLGAQSGKTGLEIAALLIEVAGGTFEVVSSSAEMGTRIGFSLPLVGEASEPAKTQT